MNEPSRRSLLPLLDLPMRDHARGKRSPITCALTCGNACAGEVCSTSSNDYFRDIASVTLSRRGLLGLGMAGAVALVFAGPGRASAAQSATAAPGNSFGAAATASSPLEFSPIAPVPSLVDEFTVTSPRRSSRTTRRPLRPVRCAHPARRSCRCSRAASWSPRPRRLRPPAAGRPRRAETRTCSRSSSEAARSRPPASALRRSRPAVDAAQARTRAKTSRPTRRDWARTAHHRVACSLGDVLSRFRGIRWAALGRVGSECRVGSERWVVGGGVRRGARTTGARVVLLGCEEPGPVRRFRGPYAGFRRRVRNGV